MDPWGIVLGAVLALATSFIMELVRPRLGQRRARGFFLTQLSIEVPLILATLEELVTDHGKMGYFPLTTAGRVQAQRHGYDRNQNVLVVVDAPLRREIITFYQRLTAVTLELIGTEQLAQARPELKNYVDRKRGELVGALRDVANLGRGLVQHLPAE